MRLAGTAVVAPRGLSQFSLGSRQRPVAPPYRPLACRSTWLLSNATKVVLGARPQGNPKPISRHRIGQLGMVWSISPISLIVSLRAAITF